MPMGRINYYQGNSAVGGIGGLVSGIVDTNLQRQYRQQELERQQLMLQSHLLQSGQTIDQNGRVVELPDQELKRKAALDTELSNMQKAREESQKAIRENTPYGMLQKSSEVEKKGVGLITNVLGSLKKYEDAFNAGQRPRAINPTTPIIGGLVQSQPIDQEQQQLVADMNKFQVGMNNLSPEERNMLHSLLPRGQVTINGHVIAGDSDDMIKYKLGRIRENFEDYLRAQGFQPEQLKSLGFDPQKLGYQQTKQGLIPKNNFSETSHALANTSPQQLQGGGLLQGLTGLVNKQSTPAQTVSPQDQQAIDWAKQNRNDPRASQILQIHGMQ